MAHHGRRRHAPRLAVFGQLRFRHQDGDLGAVYRYRKPIVIASLICGDLVSALLAISCTKLLIGAIGLSAAAPSRLFIPFVILAFFVFGLYTGSGLGPYERFRQRMLGVAGFIGLTSIAALPNQNVIAFMVAQFTNALFLLLLSHYIETATRALLIRVDFWGAPTVLIGAAEDCRKLAHFLKRKPDLGLRPVGLIQTADQSEPVSLPLFGTMDNLDNIRPSVGIEVALFATSGALAAVPRDCPAFPLSCRFLLLEDIKNIQGLCWRTRTIDTMIGIEIRRDIRSWQNRLLKRTFDLLIAIPAALLVLPVVALSAFMIKLVDKGPAFYVQKRVGYNGATVRVLKLRTMYVDSQRLLEEHLQRNPQANAEWQRFFKLRHDPRILPVIGNFIRRSSLDELPQIWNVIRGDMSLVGPRPLPAYHAEQFDEEFQSLRTRVLPGITGLWQVSSRSDGDLQILREQDLFYIRNWSPWLDLYILVQTVPAVLGAKGAR